MKVAFMGSEVEIDLVAAGGRMILVVGDYQVPAPAGFGLRKTYSVGDRLAVEFSRRDSGCERVCTRYLDFESMTWRDVQHTEGLRRAHRRVRTF